MKVVYPICCGVDVHKKSFVATIITSEGITPRYQKKRFSTFNKSILAFKTNRFQNAFTVCNVALESVVSDMFGKSASSITDYILTSDVFDQSVCTSFLQRSLKSKADEVIESIEEFMMEPAQKARALMVRNHLEFLDQRIAELDRMVDVLVVPYESLIELLCTIPGVDRRSAITIISEIGIDMSQFSSSKRICSWAGLTPGNNESAGKKKSVRISRAGVYLNPALVQVAHAAVKSNESPYYRVKYERISKRRGKKRAIIAIARMILTAVYSMMSTGEVFNPCDLYKIDMPHELQDSRREKAIRQAKKFLLSQGITDLSQVAA
jgi:transposase